MSRIIPLGAIPKTNLLPDGIFRMRVKKVEGVQTKEAEGKVQKYMIRMVSEVVEPANLKGLGYFENFVIGTDTDPDAELLETWQTSIGGRQFARFTDKSGVAFGDEEQEDSMFNALVGAEYLATVVQKTDDGKRDARYKGRVSNSTTAYWSLGEKNATLANGQTTTTAAGASAKAGTFRTAQHVEE